ncbi:MAG: helicase-associated domain-containing protein [Cryobacterium sp.]
MLTLATRLRALDDDALRCAISARGVPATGIRDFFDLAEALLDPAAVQGTLAHLDRPVLAVLAIAGELATSRTAGKPAPTIAELAGRLSELGDSPVSEADVAARAGELDRLLLARLADGRLEPYDEVSTLLHGWPERGLPSATQLAATPAPAPRPAPSDKDIRFAERLATERAFAAVSAIAELLTELSREPARELSRGGLGLPDTKRLAAVMTVELDAVSPLVAAAARAGLIARSGGHWMGTEAGEAWMLEGTTRRWGALAAAWLGALPVDVRELLASRPSFSWGEGLRAFVVWLFPAGGDWMDERIAEFTRDAELIGISAHHTTSRAGTALLAGDPDGAIALMAASLPAEVGAVYLQHDLSIVAPGPLSPSIDARLRGLADVESRELASSYRITAASVNRGLAAGENADSMLDFLRGVSLSGIPQPVEYLIRESAARYGLVRVGTDALGGPTVHSYVRSDDAALLGTIAVDQTLAPLGLVAVSEHRLNSRFPADAVFWSLTDARYPAAAEDATGEIVHLRRHQLATVETVQVPDASAALVAKIRAGDGGEKMAAGAWLARQLDTAIKSKLTVTVSIAMPGGVVVDYLLEPASVGGGRFRARDRRADIERTLPLSSVISITPHP